MAEISEPKFKKIVYFENKKVVIRDFRTTMILNLIPMFMGCSIGLIPFIGRMLNQPLINISILQLIILFALGIFSWRHLSNLKLVNKYKEKYYNKELEIVELRKSNILEEEKLFKYNADAICDYMIEIEQKIKKLRPNDKFKSIMYLKILLSMDSYELLELLQQKFYVFGYGDDIDADVELDMFNTSKLKNSEYFDAIINLFVNLNLNDLFMIEDLNSGLKAGLNESLKENLENMCKNYLLLFYTDI